MVMGGDKISDSGSQKGESLGENRSHGEVDGFQFNAPSKTLVVIPARLDSTRLPRKMLLDIGGVPLIQRVYQQVSALSGFETVVAVDSDELASVIEAVGGRAIITDFNLPSGSDRIAAAVSSLDPEGRKYEIIVNFQGDAVNTSPQVVRELVDLLIRTDSDITTCFTKMEESLRDDPSAVKIALGLRDGEDEARCLYFSRSTIPFDRDHSGGGTLYHHIGVYAYKRAALLRFVNAEPGVLERREKLEQLRALELGMTIWGKFSKDLSLYTEKSAIAESKDFSSEGTGLAPLDVDTYEDLARMRTLFCNLQSTRLG
jgi:3-deoxy-manno-octulosonate cytidylyltransferase (CMP-KDO synthetase)